MTQSWLKNLLELATVHGGVVRVSVIRAEGSAPCSVGSAMVLTPDSFHGTIGGGALELAALDAARAMLEQPPDASNSRWQRAVRDFPLGPALAQCCGGHVRLLFERFAASEAGSLADTDIEDALIVRPVASGTPVEIISSRKGDNDTWPLGVRGAVRDMLSGARPSAATQIDGWFIEPANAKRDVMFLYGAGHVGRAVVNTFAGLPFDIYWIDTDAKRYPDTVPASVHPLVSANPADAARHAPGDAWHVVMTFSHAIDFDVCHTVLARGDFAYLGVIASKTKRGRFIRRLNDAGVADAAIQRLQAPIGLPDLRGKEPAQIAVSLAADFLFRRQERAIVAARNDARTEQGGA